MNIINNKSFNKQEKAKKIFNKKNLLKRNNDKTNRLNNLNLYSLYSFNTTTIRQGKKHKSRILTSFNTKRELKNNNNISLIRKKAYNSNPKGKKKSINIYIDEKDLINENLKKKNNIPLNLNDKKVVKNVKQKAGGVLRSLINSNNNNSLKRDLMKRKLKYSYSRTKSKDINNNNINNNIKIVFSINENNLNINKKKIELSQNKDVKESLDIKRNLSCKNKDISKNNNKIKKLNFNFSSSKIQKKKIHFISQIKPKENINKQKLSKSIQKK